MEPLKTDQLDQFCWRLSRLLGAGITIQESITLMLQEDSVASKEQLTLLSDELMKGNTLSQAMKDVGGFPDDMQQMIAIGEMAGRLEQVLQSLAKYYVRQKETKDALRRAVGYPALMASLIVFVFSIVLTQVLPIFSRVFAQVGAGVPAFLTGMVNMSSAGRVVIYAICIILLALAGVMFWRIEKDREMPLGKGVTLAVDRNRFTAAFAMLLQSGVSIDSALEMSARLMGKSHFSSALQAAAKLFLEGTPLAKALAETHVLSQSEAGFLAVGVRSGSTDEAMAEISARCAEESDQMLVRALGRFEFIIVMTLCLLVALILMAVILPLIGVLTAIA